MSPPDRLVDWVALVDDLYPPADASDWDATGLQAGDPDDPVHAVLVCVDVTAATLDEAVHAGADLILAHHPLLFRPLQRLTPSTAAGGLALRAARQRIALLAVHSNFDVAQTGTTDPIVKVLDLRGTRVLADPRPDPTAQVKLVTFVPRDDTTGVLQALAAAGAGVIGEYDHCSFRVSGTGSFRPSPSARPTVGERGRLNEVAEDRLEMLVPSERLDAAVAALLAAHPYEEVAYDVYPLATASHSPPKGLGRVGTLPESLSLRQVADRLAVGLPSPHLRVAGDLDRSVRTVAACGGAGDALVEAAVAAGADVYVTGDLRHHPALDALSLGLATIDAGHYATEAPAMAVLQEALSGAAAARGLTARLIASTVRTEPWTSYAPPASRPPAGVPRGAA